MGYQRGDARMGCHQHGVSRPCLNRSQPRVGPPGSGLFLKGKPWKSPRRFRSSSTDERSRSTKTTCHRGRRAVRPCKRPCRPFPPPPFPPAPRPPPRPVARPLQADRPPLPRSLPYGPEKGREPRRVSRDHNRDRERILRAEEAPVRRRVVRRTRRSPRGRAEHRAPNALSASWPRRSLTPLRQTATRRARMSRPLSWLCITSETGSVTAARAASALRIPTIRLLLVRPIRIPCRSRLSGGCSRSGLKVGRQ